MAKKGLRKVRTGCHTCKSRKIKCDEARPKCQKCINLGQECAGYDHVAPSQRSIDRKKRRLKEASRAIAMWKKDAREWLLSDLYIDKDLLRSNFITVMSHLEDSINILNDDTHGQQTQIVASIQSLIIIQMCHYNAPDFPSLHTQHRLTQNIAIGALGMVSSIENIEHASNSAILEAVQYVRSVIPGTRTDSRLTPNGPVISAPQGQIFASFDQWHSYLRHFIAYSPKYNCQPLSKRDSLSWMEAQMKYRTAKICVYVCHYRDESVYDYFKDFFEGVVSFAKSILGSYTDTRNPTDYEFDFEKSSYLPLLKFVILKCRWLGIRYDAWLILRKLAIRQKKPVIYNELCDLGQRMIEKEHHVRIEEVTKDNAERLPPPPEELRVRHYTTDERFADLVTVQCVDREGLARVQRTYTQRLLLRCGSYELNHLTELVERILLSPSENEFNLWLLDSRTLASSMEHADTHPLPTSSVHSPLRPCYSVEQIDFITYCYVDCGLAWPKIVEQYNKTFPSGAGGGHQRRMGGLRAAYYRERVGSVTNSNELLASDEGNKLKGLLDMHPESAITYSWVSEEHKEQCRTLGKLRQDRVDMAIYRKKEIKFRNIHL